MGSLFSEGMVLGFGPVRMLRCNGARGHGEALGGWMEHSGRFSHAFACAVIGGGAHSSVGRGNAGKPTWDVVRRRRSGFPFQHMMGTMTPC